MTAVAPDFLAVLFPAALGPLRTAACFEWRETIPLAWRGDSTYFLVTGCPV